MNRPFEIKPLKYPHVMIMNRHLNRESDAGPPGERTPKFTMPTRRHAVANSKCKSLKSDWKSRGLVNLLSFHCDYLTLQTKMADDDYEHDE